ncbi:hypothetical protein HPB50_015742 [Hyalomma asiaticum]|uniref:Uncharacterized protein n=1 Tax=Hyalomma asiaticum TaxID=266040 RepID=A0ACB7T1A1_HYAAI|nr:hypothetical protein HPB50_015742 [Hyalomma asiaticum]
MRTQNALKCRLYFENQIRCALCAGPYVTGDRRCKGRYRLIPPIPPPEGQAGPRNESFGADRSLGSWTIVLRRRGPSPLPPTLSRPRTLARGFSGLPYEAQLWTDPPVKRSAAGQASPAPAKPNPLLPVPKPAAQGNSSWSNRVRKGAQVSGSGGAAFASPPSMIPQPTPPAPSSLTCEQIAFR